MSLQVPSKLIVQEGEQFGIMPIDVNRNVEPAILARLAGAVAIG